MDNLCHTFAGAAFGEAGLKGRTRFAGTTLMIAANLPDIDVLVFATDVPWVAFRRGWTHGVLAQALLPIMLAGLVYAFGRARRRSAALEADFRWLLALSYLGVLSHVGLDLLNNYGVRLLMPFSEQWFYGDSVFIVDVWLWLALGAGVLVSFSRAEHTVARAALAASGIYIGALVLSAAASRAWVVDQWHARHGTAPRSLMVGPMPFTPLRRLVIVDDGDSYAMGTFTWFPRRVTFEQRVAKNETHPSVRAALATDRRVQAVRAWARFPYYEVVSGSEGDIVTLQDLRFAGRVGGVTARVPPQTSQRLEVFHIQRVRRDRAGPLGAFRLLGLDHQR